MKNGLFNLIRGIAFCFVLSIICLFGRVDVKADTIPYSQITGKFIYELCCNKVGADMTDITFNSNIIRNGMNKNTYYAPPMVSDDSYPYAIFSDKFSDTLYQFYVVSMPKNPVSDNDVETYCNNYSYCQISQNFVYDSSNKKVYALGYADNGSIQAYGFTSMKIAVANKNSSGVFSVSGTDSNSWGSVSFYSYRLDVLYNSNQSSEPKYDSSLGYLKNCVVKRGTTSLKNCKSFSEVFTHNMDSFSWDSLTTTSREVKKVEYKLYFYNGSSVVHKENSFIENSRAGAYATSKIVFWNTFTDINWKDILINKNAHYEIWFRPCEDNLYGDWCYFNISLPSWLNRFLNSYNENDGDILSCFLNCIENELDILGDGYYDLGQCTYAEKEGTYEPSENLDTNHSFSNVVNSYVVNYIDNSDNSVDDVTNIIESLPPSTNSYSEIYNNITVIQNGNENGSSLIDKLGDMLSLCKDFLTFIYNFINLILSPLSFLPSWLKSLLSMSIIAFIVICVIKTVRG